MDNTYSEIRVEKLPKMRVAKHTVISPTPEEDVSIYMDNWAKASGLAVLKDYTPRSFGWDDNIPDEDKQKNPDFRGYSKCMTLPDDFIPKHNDVAYMEVWYPVA